jgi:hypothetical protein
LESEVTPLIVKALKEELNKSKVDRIWISSAQVELPTGKSTSVKKLIDDLTLFRNKLTALRVGIEFIPNLDVNII